MLKRWIEVRTPKSAWLIDMDFMLSSYECSWGTSCKGINPSAPDLGCCANGAYLDEKDIALLEKRVPQLTPENWQNYGADYLEKVVERNKFGIPKDKQFKTALVDPKDSVSGCVFANREGFGGGKGCALHIGAMQAGEDFIDWKPSICWQMPLLADYSEELDMNILRMFNWTTEDYPWFCGHDEVSWVAEKPLFRTMERELKALICDIDESAYLLILGLCETAYSQGKKKPEKKRIPVTIQVL